MTLEHFKLVMKFVLREENARCNLKSQEPVVKTPAAKQVPARPRILHYVLGDTRASAAAVVPEILVPAPAVLGVWDAAALEPAPPPVQGNAERGGRAAVDLADDEDDFVNLVSDSDDDA
jgi:hypothetical protein